MIYIRNRIVSLQMMLMPARRVMTGPSKKNDNINTFGKDHETLSLHEYNNRLIFFYINIVAPC